VSALLLYAFRKSLRDRFLWPLLLGPVTLLAAMAGGISVDARLVGREPVPFRITTLDDRETEAVMLSAILILAAAAAAAGAFWVFRRDYASGSVVSFLLATRWPQRIAVAAASFGVLTGVASAVLAVAALPVVLHPSAATLGLLALRVTLVSVAAAFAGAACAGSWPAPGNVVVMALAGALLAVAVWSMTPAASAALAFVVMAGSVAAARRAAERLCAI
jgi:hypothetical protein